jgi:hypothetical protein
VATAVYILCAITSCLCAALLLRGYLAGRTRLLLWSSLCFVFLAANNVLLVFDKLIVTGTDLALARVLTALAGVAVLLYGLIWEAR